MSTTRQKRAQNSHPGLPARLNPPTRPPTQGQSAHQALPRTFLPSFRNWLSQQIISGLFRRCRHMLGLIHEFSRTIMVKLLFNAVLLQRLHIQNVDLTQRIRGKFCRIDAFAQAAHSSSPVPLILQLKRVEGRARGHCVLIRKKALPWR